MTNIAIVVAFSQLYALSLVRVCPIIKLSNNHFKQCYGPANA